MIIQTCVPVDFDETFAHPVGQRGDQSPYVALYVGGHDGVRLSFSTDECRAVAALLLRVADDVDAGADTVSGTRIRQAVSA